MLTPAVYATTAPSLYSIYYSSYLGAPVYGLSLPLSFFNDNALPKIAMVPPHELKKCKYAVSCTSFVQVSPIDISSEGHNDPPRQKKKKFEGHL